LAFNILWEYFRPYSLIVKINVRPKHSDLVTILRSHFEKDVHFARIKLIAYVIIALCKVQTVSFEKLALAFDSVTKADSSLRRIQRFMAKAVLSSDLVAKLIFSLLPEKTALQLTIDRSNWKFGDSNINIFMLGIFAELSQRNLILTTYKMKHTPHNYGLMKALLPIMMTFHCIAQS